MPSLASEILFKQDGKNSLDKARSEHTESKRKFWKEKAPGLGLSGNCTEGTRMEGVSAAFFSGGGSKSLSGGSRHKQTI